MVIKIFEPLKFSQLFDYLYIISKPDVYYQFNNVVFVHNTSLYLEMWISAPDVDSGSRYTSAVYSRSVGDQMWTVV